MRTLRKLARRGTEKYAHMQEKWLKVGLKITFSYERLAQLHFLLYLCGRFSTIVSGDQHRVRFFAARTVVYTIVI